MQLRGRWRIRTLMVLVLVAAAVFYVDLLRRRRARFLALAAYYSAREKQNMFLLAVAQSRLAWAERMRGRGYVSDAQVAAQEAELEKAMFGGQRGADDRMRRLYENAAAHPWLSVPAPPKAAPP